MDEIFTVLIKIYAYAHFYHFHLNSPNFYPTLGLCPVSCVQREVKPRDLATVSKAKLPPMECFNIVAARHAACT
jgi:hypothetical protein